MTRKPASQRIPLGLTPANWTQYRDKLEEQLNLWNNIRQIKSALYIEEYTAFITECVNAAMHEAITTAKTLDAKYEISDAFKRLIQQKHQSCRRWKKNGEEMDKKHYYTIGVLRTKSLRHHKQNHLQHLMKSLRQKRMYSNVGLMREDSNYNQRRPK